MILKRFCGIFEDFEKYLAVLETEHKNYEIFKLPNKLRKHNKGKDIQKRTNISN